LFTRRASAHKEDKNSYINSFENKLFDSKSCPVTGFSEHCNLSFGLIKGGKFTDQLNNQQLFKKARVTQVH
jgi:hypothetical protein